MGARQGRFIGELEQQTAGKQQEYEHRRHDSKAPVQRKVERALRNVNRSEMQRKIAKGLPPRVLVILVPGVAFRIWQTTALQDIQADISTRLLVLAIHDFAVSSAII
jgi:hypothetical protein